MAIIQANNLTKKFGEFTAVSNLNISIKKGELTAYLGSNGAGKSTTIAMLIGTFEPTAGEILYEGLKFLEIIQQFIQLMRIFEFIKVYKQLNSKLRINLSFEYQEIHF